MFVQQDIYHSHNNLWLCDCDFLASRSEWADRTLHQTQNREAADKEAGVCVGGGGDSV